MNPYYYLFYKLSQFLNKKGNNEWGPIAAITFIPLLSIAPFVIMLIPDDITDLKNVYGYALFGFAIAFFIVNTFLFLNKKRLRKIHKQFQGESLRSKRIGNFIVLIYIVLAIISIFIV
jgi:uncharacterized BrkB/YihY/UPF0761 family membrane protein